MIIDSHTHLFDVLTGYPIENKLTKYSFGITMLLEWLGYRKGKKTKPGKIIKFFGLIDNLKRSECGALENLLLYMKKYDIKVSLVWAVEPFVLTSKLLEVTKNINELLVVGSINVFNNPEIDITKELYKFNNNNIVDIKLHPVVQNISPNSELFFNIIEEYSKYKKPVFLHTGKSTIVNRNCISNFYSEIKNFKKIVANFPNVLFVFGHLGNNEPEEAIALAEKHSNIILETSYQNNKVIKKAINRVGINRIIFGSDFPYSRQKYALKEIYKLKLKTDDLEKILYKNIKSIIKV